MTGWSTSALLLLGIISGPYGLNLLSESVLLQLDPAIAMALGIVGVFVGLNVDSHHPKVPRLFAASAVRAIGTIAAVAIAAYAALSYWRTGMDSPAWVLVLMLGVCAAASSTEADVNIDNLPAILAGGAIGAAISGHEQGALVAVAALAGISMLVAVAGWLLVGQTAFEAEQHVFVVGSLLLLGGAATYLSLSAVAAGLAAGLVWNIAGNVAKPRIIRDLNYFQHPLVVLLLVSAGAAATLSGEAMLLAAVYVAVRALAKSAAVARDFSLTSAGLVGIALALDALRGPAAPEWGAPLLGAVALGSIVSDSLSLAIPAQIKGR
jgi:hypothetical protein